MRKEYMLFLLTIVVTPFKIKVIEILHTFLLRASDF